MKKFLIALGIVLGLILITTGMDNGTPEKVVSIIKNTTNETVDSSYVVIDMGIYNHFSLDIKLAGGVTCKSYATLDESLSSTDTSGWARYSTTLFGSDSITDVHRLIVESGYFSPVKIMLYFENSDDSNSNKTILQKSL